MTEKKLTELYSFMSDRFEDVLTEADYDAVYIDWWETEFRYAVYSRVLDEIAKGVPMDDAIQSVMDDEKFIKDTLSDARSLAEFV